VPAEGIHLTALREAMAAPALDPSLRRRLIRRDDAARFGALVPDLPYFHRYVGVLEAANAVLDAGPSDLDRARGALAKMLPSGTIDPQGDELDLARPVGVSLRSAAM
jgi:hypothetical protein